MDIKCYRVIVEFLNKENSSGFLTDIAAQGYVSLITRAKILSFDTIDEAFKAVEFHAFNWMYIKYTS